MDVQFDEITEEDFRTYEHVRKSGAFNMLTPQAVSASGLDKATYLAVPSNYDRLMEKYPHVRED